MSPTAWFMAAPMRGVSGSRVITAKTRDGAKSLERTAKEPAGVSRVERSEGGAETGKPSRPTACGAVERAGVYR